VIILDSAVEGVLRSLRMACFCCSKLISLQPINSPFGFGQYRLSTLHFAESRNETGRSCFLRTPQTAFFRKIVLPMVLLMTAASAVTCPAWGEEMKLGAHQGSREPAGPRVVDEKCVACHNRQRIESAMRKRADMEKIQKRMEEKGVVLTETERSVLSHFWHQNPFREEGKKPKGGSWQAR
jgi:hypothetical protein